MAELTADMLPPPPMPSKKRRPIVIPQPATNPEETCINRRYFKFLHKDLLVDYAKHYNIKHPETLHREELAEIFCRKNEWIPALDQHMQRRTKNGVVVFKHITRDSESATTAYNHEFDSPNRSSGSPSRSGRFVPERLLTPEDEFESENESVSDEVSEVSDDSDTTLSESSFDFPPKGPITGYNQDGSAIHGPLPKNWFSKLADTLEALHRKVQADMRTAQAATRDAAAAVMQFQAKLGIESTKQREGMNSICDIVGPQVARRIREDVIYALEHGELPEMPGVLDEDEDGDEYDYEQQEEEEEEWVVEQIEQQPTSSEKGKAREIVQDVYSMLGLTSSEFDPPPVDPKRPYRRPILENREELIKAMLAPLDDSELDTSPSPPRMIGSRQWKDLIERERAHVHRVITAASNQSASSSRTALGSGHPSSSSSSSSSLKRQREDDQNDQPEEEQPQASTSRPQAQLPARNGLRRTVSMMDMSAHFGQVPPPPPPEPISRTTESTTAALDSGSNEVPSRKKARIGEGPSVQDQLAEHAYDIQGLRKLGKESSEEEVEVVETQLRVDIEQEIEEEKSMREQRKSWWLSGPFAEDEDEDVDMDYAKSDSYSGSGGNSVSSSDRSDDGILSGDEALSFTGGLSDVNEGSSSSKTRLTRTHRTRLGRALPRPLHQLALVCAPAPLRAPRRPLQRDDRRILGVSPTSGDVILTTAPSQAYHLNTDDLSEAERDTDSETIAPGHVHGRRCKGTRSDSTDMPVTRGWRVALEFEGRRKD